MKVRQQNREDVVGDIFGTGRGDFPTDLPIVRHDERLLVDVPHIFDAQPGHDELIGSMLSVPAGVFNHKIGSAHLQCRLRTIKTDPDLHILAGLHESFGKVYQTLPRFAAGHTIFVTPGLKNVAQREKEIVTVHEHQRVLVPMKNTAQGPSTLRLHAFRSLAFLEQAGLTYQRVIDRSPLERLKQRMIAQVLDQPFTAPRLIEGLGAIDQPHKANGQRRRLAREGKRLLNRNNLIVQVVQKGPQFGNWIDRGRERNPGALASGFEGLQPLLELGPVTCVSILLCLKLKQLFSS
jgi:hypothetical protein